MNLCDMVGQTIVDNMHKSLTRKIFDDEISGEEIDEAILNIMEVESIFNGNHEMFLKWKHCESGK